MLAGKASRRRHRARQVFQSPISNTIIPLFIPFVAISLPHSIISILHSINSHLHSIIPLLPLVIPISNTQDTRKKLHNDLVEYTSKMKGAIPVLPLYLAWFCAFCNVVFPGLGGFLNKLKGKEMVMSIPNLPHTGTLLSGLFCLCVGIPRFSQFDSARARIGAFIINIIVAVSQFFCVLFCFVGWGWSIWWGTIMLRCASKKDVSSKNIRF